MNDFVEKLIERLEAEQKYQYEKAEEADKKINLEMISISEARRKSVQCFDVAIQVIEQLAEEYNNGWIPCSERLPKDGDFVLVTVNVPQKHEIIISIYDNKTRSFFEDGTVIAWQPLPAPYQTKNEALLYERKSKGGEYQEYQGGWI